jgi:hypothetical protein
MAIDKEGTVDEVVSFIEGRLSQGGSRSVKITPVEELVGVNKTYRCVMETGIGADATTESIIIKYRPPGAIPSQSQRQKLRGVFKDLADHMNRFSNEVAALTFLNGIEIPATTHPRLIYHDVENLLIVTEDMGRAPTLMDLLNQPTLEDPETYLDGYVELLAELHKHTINRWRRFKDIQEGFGAYSPLSDSTMDFRGYSHEFAALLDALGSRYGLDKEATLMELNRVEETVFDPFNPLYGFIHADSGIQNVNVDPESREMTLFDYEFAATGYVLLDLAGLFLGFPQSGRGRRIPRRFYGALIERYFDSLSLSIDDPRAELDYALLHWTVGRIISSWVFHIKDRPGGDVEPEVLSRLFTSNQECLGFIDGDERFPHLSMFIRAVQSHIPETWGNVEPLDYFSSLT